MQFEEDVTTTVLFEPASCSSAAVAASVAAAAAAFGSVEAFEDDSTVPSATVSNNSWANADDGYTQTSSAGSTTADAYAFPYASSIPSAAGASEPAGVPAIAADGGSHVPDNADAAGISTAYQLPNKVFIDISGEHGAASPYKLNVRPKMTRSHESGGKKRPVTKEHIFCGEIQCVF